MKTYKAIIKTTIPTKVVKKEETDTLADAMFKVWTQTTRINGKMYRIDNLEWEITMTDTLQNIDGKQLAYGWYDDGMLPVVRCWDNDRD